jgi:hypothetical protein
MSCSVVQRVLFHVEGQTEETFVQEVLAPSLYETGFASVGVRRLGNPRQQRGGIRPWPAVRLDLLRHLKEDPGCLHTTLVDYYRLPQTKTGAWPGRAEANALSHEQKASFVENAMLCDVEAELGGSLDEIRFVPFVVMHEFETLLFSDCEKLSSGIGQPRLAADFQEIRDAYETPEHINDSPHTAPSKRIMNLVPHYEKPLFGVLAALEIGLPRILEACPHFAERFDCIRRFVALR